MVPPLEELPAFQADYGARLRESPFYVWLNVKALLDLISKPSEAADGPSRVAAVFSATGMGNLSAASLSYKHYPQGDCAQLFLAVPEEKRPALLKIFAADAKDASPPPFVPADAVKFWRWRLNIPRSWKMAEAMLADLVSPQVVAQINMFFGMAGKDKDEHYDLKSELLNNLGDDIICYAKAPNANTLADLRSRPTLYLLASPNPDKLTAAIKVLLAIPFRGAPVTDREFLGRKIYTVTSPAAGAAAASSFSFSASGGYVAMSDNAGMLEEYLRSNDSKTKALMDMPGLADAAQKAGGMKTGLFGYENENQGMRPVFDILRKKPLAMQDIFGMPLPPAAGGDQMDSLRQWADFSLLPPFDAVSKYFYFSVYAGSFSPDGFALKIFMPTPPQLRQ